MARMNINVFGLLEEPCLSCDKSRFDGFFDEWCCDEKECPYKEKRERLKKYEQMRRKKDV